MGTVIKFPRVRGRAETPARAAGASAAVVILPVVRIERAPDAPPGVRAKPAKSATARPLAKAPRRRRKRATPAALPAPARLRG
jgi:hypothetical protein